MDCRHDDDAKLEAAPAVWWRFGLQHLRLFRKKMKKNPQLPLDPSVVEYTSCKNILDVLNADCWRHVLDYVDINDVVRSERVSRGWQQVVLGYLPGVKSYRIHHRSWCGTFAHYSIDLDQYRCIYLNWDKTMCQSMIQKMGPYIKKLLLCNSNFRNISLNFGEHCPNIEDITFYGINQEIPFEALKFFKRLEKVTIMSYSRVTEFYMDGYIRDEIVTHEKIINGEQMSGSFLAVAGTNLTSLTLKACPLLKIEGLDQSEDFSRLTELVLNFISPETITKVSTLIRKAPQLEILSLDGYKEVVREELVAAIGGLSELKRLVMGGIATDALLDAIANGCKKLRCLNVNGSSAVSGRAVRALCRELPRLTELSVAGSQATDEDLTLCISYGSITALDASGCAVSRALVAAAARDVRRRPRTLFLRLHGTERDADQDWDERRLGLKVTWKSFEQEQQEEEQYYRCFGRKYKPIIKKRIQREIT